MVDPIPGLTDAEARRFLQNALDAVQDGIALLDPECAIVWVNTWMETRFASDMPLIGRRCEGVFPSISQAFPENNVGARCDANFFPPQIVAHGSPEKGPIWLELSVSCIEDDEGKLLGGLLHVRDVTERRLAEEMLRDEISRRRMLVEQSRDGIVVLDESGKVVESNHQFARMLGYSMDEMSSLCVWDWEAAVSIDGLLEMLKNSDGSGDQFETVHRRKDGSTYEVEISTNGAVFGGTKYIFCVCRDTSERKRAEKEREELIRELQEALAEINALRGIVPLCSYCNKIRDDQGYWEQVDVYIQKHSDAKVSHGICPECMREMFPDLCDQE